MNPIKYQGHRSMVKVIDIGRYLQSYVQFVMDVALCEVLVYRDMITRPSFLNLNYDHLPTPLQQKYMTIYGHDRDATAG